jgi:8-oxo-dGTP pyrophosphatase MutT (NUDIX family)
MLGLFGGHREEDETFLECVSREVREEISYLIPLDGFELLARYANTEPHVGSVRGEFFIARNIPSDSLKITEGSLHVATPDDLPSLMPRIAPPARTAITLFLSRQGD